MTQPGASAGNGSLEGLPLGAGGSVPWEVTVWVWVHEDSLSRVILGLSGGTPAGRLPVPAPGKGGKGGRLVRLARARAPGPAQPAPLPDATPAAAPLADRASRAAGQTREHLTQGADSGPYRRMMPARQTRPYP